MWWRAAPLSLSLSPFLHPKRERTPEETTPRRFSYYFWESLGPIVLAIPRDSVPFFLPSWSEDPRWTRGEKRGRRNRAEDGFGVIEMTRGSNAEFDETRRDEANRRTTSFLSARFSKRRGTLRYVSSFFFLFFIGQETSPTSMRRERRGEIKFRSSRGGLGWANRANREILVYSSLHLFFARSNEPTSFSFLRPLAVSLVFPPSFSSSSSSSSPRSTPLHASFSLRSSCSPLSPPSPRVASSSDGSSAFEARKPKLNYQLDVARRHAFAR